MGRKQKLKQKRTANKKKNEELAAAAAAAAMTTTTGTPFEGSGILTAVVNNAACRRGVNHSAVIDLNYKELDGVFPESDYFVRGYKLVLDNPGSLTMANEISILFFRGAVEYGCIHSMQMAGQARSHERGIHTAQSWFLEAAIRGNYIGVLRLNNEILVKATPHVPVALRLYWDTIIGESSEFRDVANSAVKGCKESINRYCWICNKEDTETLTLRQCMGCSMCCYCGMECQRVHWEEQNHRNECKQIQILNKYHKPYATEIREAVIRGEIVIPALEKLRYKLGLSRPIEEYRELRDYNTHEGKTIIPSEYVIGREDGTVWIGSYPWETGNNAESNALLESLYKKDRLKKDKKVVEDMVGAKPIT